MSSRSDKVLLPWSMWAIMEKFRICMGRRLPSSSRGSVTVGPAHARTGILAKSGTSTVPMDEATDFKRSGGVGQIDAPGDRHNLAFLRELASDRVRWVRFAPGRFREAASSVGSF